MGLCKCRVVTNLFCFEHKTNVCEKCIVATHPRCVVKSYLQWLQDSDYDSSCALCRGSLATGDVVRLTCLDLYHRACLDGYAASLPEHTAPSGFACPKCGVPIIPPENSASPVAMGVRLALRTSPWAKPILGIQDVVANGSGAFEARPVAGGGGEGAHGDGKKSATVSAGPSIAGQAVLSRKQQSAAMATAAAYVQQGVGGVSSTTISDDADEELHKYKHRKGFFTRLLQMSFWHINGQGDLVLNVPRLLLFLFFVSVVVVGAIVYYNQLGDTSQVRSFVISKGVGLGVGTAGGPGGAAAAAAGVSEGDGFDA